MNDFERIEKKIDKINDKLDDHLGRLSKTEESVNWMKGYIKVLTASIISTATGIILWLVEHKP